MGEVSEAEAVVIGTPVSATLTFGRVTDGGVTGGLDLRRLAATLRSAGLEASTGLEFETRGLGPAGLAGFFEDLDRSWRGWSGARQWADDQANMLLSATHDGVGSITLDVSMPLTPHFDIRRPWAVRVQIRVEPGSLAETARALRTLVGGM